MPPSKNTVLPAIAAAAVARAPVFIRPVPRLADVNALIRIVRCLGIEVRSENDGIVVDGSRGCGTAVPPSLSSSLRGSVYSIAIMASLAGRGTIGPIGGDSLAHPRNRRSGLLPHRRALAGFGLSLEQRNGGWALAGGAPRPGELSIGDDGASATILAAIIGATLDGQTVIRGAGPELEIDDVLCVLRRLGAACSRVDEAVIIRGPLSRKAATLLIPPDRIYAGTMAIAASATGGSVSFPSAVAKRMESTFDVLESCGVELVRAGEGVTVSGRPRRPLVASSGPYPAFPTDLIPLLSVLATVPPGWSQITEGVYSSRFGQVGALRKLGAVVQIRGNVAVVRGGTRLMGAIVEGGGIRETAALALAGLMARGTTVIRKGDSIFRGYEDLVADFKSLSASRPGYGHRAGVSQSQANA